MKIQKIWFTVFALLLLGIVGLLRTDIKTSAEATANDFEYDLNNELITITGYSGDGGNITIPEKINGDSVTSVGDYAFSNCTSLTSISIPDSITYIGKSAFTGCSGLTSISIPDSVTHIGDDAFNGAGLISISIPNGVTSIGDDAFNTCTNLTSISISDSVTSIGDRAFSNCTSLTDISIPDGVINIGRYAFYACTSLTNISIPDSVTSIGTGAFYFCRSLTDIAIPNSVTYIGDNTFFYCTNLTDISIPDSATSIGISAFSGCSSLTNISIPDSVTYIGKDAFLNCSDLTIYYSGTEQEWTQIIHSFTEYETSVTVCYNSTFPEKITLEKHTLELSINDTFTITVSVTPNNATVPKIIWHSSNPDIVSCSDDGAITALMPGTATITAKTVNGLTDTINVTVMCGTQGHTEEIIPALEATCTENGLTEGRCCSVCGIILTEQIIIPALGHQWSAWETIELPTATSDGEKIRTCNLCGESELQIISKSDAVPSPTKTPDSITSTQTPLPTNPPVATKPPTTTKRPATVISRLPQIKKITAKNKKKKNVTLSWKITSNASGYELQYATNKKFKSCKKKTSKKTKITVKGLKKKKTYFFRVRSYRWDGSKKVYGKWSSVKKVKIKK